MFTYFSSIISITIGLTAMCTEHNIDISFSQLCWSKIFFILKGIWYVMLEMRTEMCVGLYHKWLLLPSDFNLLRMCCQI